MAFVIALCDDDAQQLRYIHEILTDWAKARALDLQVHSYSNAEQFLFDYPAHPCNLLLLDIELTTQTQGLNGMDLAKKLRAKKDMLPIIFITGFSEYISEGYDVEALHYLLKPLDRGKLCEVLDKYISQKNIKTDEILVKTKDSSIHISKGQMVFLEAFGRKTQLTLCDGSVLLSELSIGQLGQLLGDFIHCHRSYLVNLRYVKSIGKTVVTLDTGTEIPLSRRLYQEVNQKFIEYYQGDQY